MKVLAVHNRYQQPGGEDAVFTAEAALLQAHGHSVIRFVADNEGAGSSPTHAVRAVWNPQARRDVRNVIRQERPDLMHVHNTLAAISPAIYGAAAAEGVPVVQTVHNYRLLCPGANLYRDGGVCESCVGRRLAWPGIVHRCYRQSVGATAVVAAIRATHDVLGTWRRIDCYIAPSEFAKQKLVEGGLDEGAIAVKPNFVDPDPGAGSHAGGYALFAGRLSPEKGLQTLVAAAARVAHPSFRLKVAGDGPLRGIAAPDTVEWLGRRTRAEVHALMKDAAFLVFPSECYETFGLTLVDAFATGLPVIASRLGAAGEIVEHGRTGLLVAPGDPDSLAEAVAWALTHPHAMRALGVEARLEFERRYTAARNFALLMDIYGDVLHRRVS